MGSGIPVSAQKSISASLESAESAIRLMQSRDFASAAEVTKNALDRDPGSAMLHEVAGTILMATGDSVGSASEFGIALSQYPGSSISLYGLCLSSVIKGERGKAADLVSAASRFGDKAACAVLDRYLENLIGQTDSLQPLSVPDSFALSARAIAAVNLEKSGKHAQAAVEFDQIVGQLPGDRYSETSGLLMTFDAKSPFSFAQSLPRGNGLSKIRSAPQTKVITGLVTLSPEDSRDVGYVVFKIDNALTSVSNSKPYNYLWDTSRVTNGAHKIEIIVYDRGGVVSSRAEREVITSNIDAPSQPTPESNRVDNVRHALWQILALKPSRQILAYNGALSARAAGNMELMTRLLSLSAAIGPDYKDTLTYWKNLGSTEAYPPIWRGDPEEKMVALTFDDGPKPGLTEILIGTLQQLRVPATFFVIGRHVTANPGTLKKVAEAGFQIENHSYTHPNLATLSTTAVERELLKTIDAVQTVSGKRMRYFRPPGGNINNDVIAIAAKWGLTPCMWTVDGESLENGSPDRLIDYVVNKASPGAIILLHNGRMTTIDGLPKIVEGLRRRGFGFLTIDQLMERRLKASSNLAISRN